MSSKKPLIIVTPNPEQIVYAQDDPHFAKILNKADVSLPDGVGLALVMRLKRIPGVEFMEDLVRLAAQRGYPIGLIGGRAAVAVQALECLKRKNPELTGWAEDPGDVDLGTLGDLDDVCEKIGKTNARLVFVGLGAPKQEYFIEKLKVESFKLKVAAPLALMSVGGSLDMIAGRTPRAPLFLRTIGVEWLWRLGQEPWRFRRQLALVKFLWLVFGKKLASKGLTL